MITVDFASCDYNEIKDLGCNERLVLSGNATKFFMFVHSKCS